MGNELSDRQAAIRLRLAGESIENICCTLKRSKPWFHKWWKRYLALGPEGLYNLTRATQPPQVGSTSDTPDPLQSGRGAPDSS